MTRSVSLMHRALCATRKFISEGPYANAATHRNRPVFLCRYCPRILKSEGARTQHVLASERCRSADEEWGLSHVNSRPPLTPSLEDIPDAHLTYIRRNTSSPPIVAQPILVTQPSLVVQPTLVAQSIVPSQLNSSLAYDERRQLYVEPFPDPRAGAPVNNELALMPDLQSYMTAMGNLGNPDYFDTAELLMTTGLTNAGRDVHLKSRLYIGMTPWANNKGLMKDVDKLPHGPDWEIIDIDLKEESQRLSRKHSSYLFKRSVLSTFRDLMANAEFKDHIQYAPRKEWTAEDRKCRVYGQMCTGDWWWDLQLSLPDKFATLVPLIASWDRTIVSVMSGGQVVYPLYLTLGNIDKSVRRRLSTHATVLLAYLPVDKFTQVSNDLERSRLRRELTQRALEKVFEELRVASEEGIVVLCADGRYRRAYPIVAGALLDYEEQAPMAGVKRYRCPKCLTPGDGWDDGNIGAPRTNSATLEALRAWLDGEGREKADELELREKPVWPWWANIPHLDCAGCIMPDFLHQLHQGMVRHLLNWTIAAGGKATIDRLFMLMPEAEGMRRFGQGISRLTQWTGRESREAAKQLLPVVACLDGDKWDTDFVRFARALLDFAYRAQASRMTDDDIERLEESLAEIHKYKGVLVRMDIFGDNSRFDKIIKLHMLSHFPPDTRSRGTPDGFSTETPEHVHIESKQAWRASNKVRPTAQMIKFLQRYEALRLHRARMNAYLGVAPNEGRRESHVVYGEDEDFIPQQHVSAGQVVSEGVEAKGTDYPGDGNGWERPAGNIVGEDDEGSNDEDEDEEQRHFPGRMRTAEEARQQVVYPNPTLSIALKPTAGRIRGIDIIAKYGATDFVSALHSYLTKHSARRYPSDFLPTAYHEFPVWHRLYLRHDAPSFDPEWPRRDVIRARPASSDLDSAFDAALLLHDHNKFGLHRYRAVRVRAIFTLPSGFEHLCSHPLVYVELFTPFSLSVSPQHMLHTLSHLRHFDGKRRVAVVSSLDLAAACHLAPQVKRLDPELDLDALHDMLDVSRYFYFNHFYNRFIYRLVDYWRANPGGK
ncbi:hypothetical protein RhiJN_21738 [Ceratobasidium sp. AG-Ba]|nr:hypothetical protein RhiJN_21738 [Ceratobasidium sp. AG-Ba]